jgi:thiol-disulfide isomerase/thioredoxin
MSSKVLRGAEKKEEAKKILQKKPILVMFFMDGCPHCESTMPHWDKMAGAHPEIETVKIEASATPDDSGVSGFPTMEYHPPSGGSVKRIDGERASPAQIEADLGLRVKGGRRRRTLRNRNRRSRKFRHRSLSRHIAFIK